MINAVHRRHSVYQTLLIAGSPMAKTHFPCLSPAKILTIGYCTYTLQLTFPLLHDLARGRAMGVYITLESYNKSLESRRQAT